MSLSDLASLATIIEVVLVAASIALVLREFRENRKLSKAANTQSFVAYSSDFNLEIIQNREMADLWVHGAEKYDTLDEVDQQRFTRLLLWWLVLHENIYYQWEAGLVEDSIYQGWASALENFVQKKKIWLFWDDLKILFYDRFVQHVNRYIAKHRVPISTA